MDLCFILEWYHWTMASCFARIQRNYPTFEYEDTEHLSSTQLISLQHWQTSLPKPVIYTWLDYQQDYWCFPFVIYCLMKPFLYFCVLPQPFLLCLSLFSTLFCVSSITWSLQLVLGLHTVHLFDILREVMYFILCKCEVFCTDSETIIGWSKYSFIYAKIFWGDQLCQRFRDCLLLHH
jgi:hypothetical protein